MDSDKGDSDTESSNELNDYVNYLNPACIHFVVYFASLYW